MAGIHKPITETTRSDPISHLNQEGEYFVIRRNFNIHVSPRLCAVGRKGISAVNMTGTNQEHLISDSVALAEN
ncbi:hypothetical protein D0Y83_04750 [Qipengyuania flava]|uniref:Uncharacterized protein n=1 Tax=Qipengyuania flava TaxID=192812 RepID=A0A5P6N9J7_9SPHN|nr:hypothetical protein D0Y83_04750 [Qipengyuania flava]